MKQLLLPIGLLITLTTLAQQEKPATKTDPRIEVRNKIPKTKRVSRAKKEERLAPKLEADKKKKAAAKKKQKSKARKSN